MRRLGGVVDASPKARRRRNEDGELRRRPSKLGTEEVEWAIGWQNVATQEPTVLTLSEGNYLTAMVDRFLLFTGKVMKA